MDIHDNAGRDVQGRQVLAQAAPASDLHRTNMPELEGFLSVTEEEVREAGLYALRHGKPEPYNGPGVWTAEDIAVEFGECMTSARLRAREAVELGLMVEVQVKNPKTGQGHHKNIQAWVLTRLYKAWKKEQEGMVQTQ
jgi:hypothetical protein